MSKQLYEEALADVKKLKEIAEDNAKRAILEAVTPRIKDLIENQLLGEEKDEEEDDDGLLLDDMPESDPVGDSMPLPDIDPEAADAISMPDEEGKLTLDLSVLTGPDDEMELSMDDEDAVSVFVPPAKMQVVKAESTIRRIESKVKNYANASSVLRETKSYLVGLVSTITEVEDMYSSLKNTKDSSAKQLLVKRLTECHKTLKKLMERETNMKKKFSLNEEDITLTLKGLPDEVEPDDVEIELVAGGEGEEEGEEEFGSEEGEEELDLGGEEEGEDGEEEGSEEEPEEEKMETRWLKGDVVVEIDENMLRREISRMRSLREETEPAAWGDGAGEVADDFEDEDLGDPLELDLSEADHQDEADKQDEADMEEMMQAYEADKQQDEGDDQQDEGDDQQDEGDDQQDEADDQKEAQKQKQQAQKQQESLKRRLAAEARLQFEAKQKAQQAKKHGQKKQQEAQQKQKEAQKQKQEAQKKQQEAQQKQKQGKKQEAQKKQQEAQQKQKQAHQKQKEAQHKKQQAKKMQEAYVYYATQFNESVRRTQKLQGILAESIARNGTSKNGGSTRLAEETDTLREKLAEVNLFNAKLLFTNKLLQNESLTKRQKAEVIERLDEAQNVREAKLVYESLVKALQGGSNGRVVSESASRGVIGSSSRPARPAATASALNEGFEADRWAKLAGIIK